MANLSSESILAKRFRNMATPLCLMVDEDESNDFSTFRQRGRGGGGEGEGEGKWGAGGGG